MPIHLTEPCEVVGRLLESGAETLYVRWQSGPAAWKGRRRSVRRSLEQCSGHEEQRNVEVGTRIRGALCLTLKEEPGREVGPPERAPEETANAEEPSEVRRRNTQFGSRLAAHLGNEGLGQRPWGGI